MNCLKIKSFYRKGTVLFSSALIVCILFMPVEHLYASVKVNVIVEGVEGEIKGNVLAYMSIVRHMDEPDLTPALIRKLNKKAPEEIRQALQPFGYYRPDIQSELAQEDSTWNARYRIDPGQPVLIDTIDLSIIGEGADDDRFKALKKDFPLKNGDILNHQQYEGAKRSLHDTAMRFGYLKARMITGRVDVYPEQQSAKVTLRFDTGPQHHFGEIRFIQETFNPDFLSRFVSFQKGETYTLSRILILQNTLNDSDYFDSVEVKPRLDEAKGDEVPVEVILKPRKHHKYTFGVGYGTDTGVRGSLGWENRRVNTIGHRFKSELRLSEIRSGLTAEYVVPLRNPRTDNMFFSSGWVTESTKTSESNKYFGGARYNHMRSDWKESLSLNYEQEKYDVGDNTGRSTLLIPGMSWTRIRADDTINARHGYRVFLDLKGAHEYLLSDTSFLQAYLQVKYIRGITSMSRLIIRGEGGVSLVSEFSELPPSKRFFAGGDNSIRGFAYNSLGPEDEDGDIKGGKHLMVGSIEYEHLLKENWSTAVFYDAGNAFDSLAGSFRHAAGFGIRWRSPVGPVRVDLAFPLNDAEKSWRIHLTIGPDL